MAIGDSPEHADPAQRVLTLAQRTAEALLAAADRQADKTRADARIAADRTGLEARLTANRVRAEAESLLVEAHATAEQLAREATVQVEEIRRQAEETLAAVRTQADRIVSEGRATAEALRIEALRAYEKALSGHGPRRAVLQQQIDGLETFDRECRRQLSAMFQSQLRALWAPPPAGENPSRRREAGSPRRNTCRPLRPGSAQRGW